MIPTALARYPPLFLRPCATRLSSAQVSADTWHQLELDRIAVVQEGFALQDKDLASGSSDTSRVHFASGAASPMVLWKSLHELIASLLVQPCSAGILGLSWQTKNVSLLGQLALSSTGAANPSSSCTLVVDESRLCRRRGSVSGLGHADGDLQRAVGSLGRHAPIGRPLACTAVSSSAPCLRRMHSVVLHECHVASSAPVVHCLAHICWPFSCRLSTPSKGPLIPLSWSPAASAASRMQRTCIQLKARSMLRLFTAAEPCQRRSGSDPSAHILDLDMPAEVSGVQQLPPASDAHRLKRARSEVSSLVHLLPVGWLASPSWQGCWSVA